MKRSSAFIRSFVFLTLSMYLFSLPLYAETVTGKIQSLRPLSPGQIEVTVLQGKEKKKLVLNTLTAVESEVPANKIKSGSKIYLSGKGSGGGGERKGFKSPFRGIPKSMRQKMGLPEIAETPDIPGAPAVPQAPQIPEVPKVPKAPKMKKAGGEETESAPQNAAAQAQPARGKVQPPEHEMTEEEKSLYGRADANKPLLKSSGGAAPQSLQRKVVKVQTTDKGVVVELEGPGGKTEQVTLAPDKKVTQALSLEELRDGMTIEAQTVKAGNQAVAQRIKVVS